MPQELKSCSRPHLILGLFLLVFLQPTSGFSSLKWQIESGAVWQNRNDVRIDPQTGTYVEFDEFNKGPFFHYRSEITYQFNKRHGIRLLYAPLNLEVSGVPINPVVFDGVNFSSGQPLNVEYRFNSYRLTYRYGLYMSSTHELYVGFTGKIREARIRFSQQGVSQEYNNVGFVPLIYFYYQKSLGPHWTLVADLDFAAASQGRAIDFALKVRRHLGKKSALGLGFRTLEGGADNEKVFTFSWLNYALVDFVYSF